MRRGCRLVDERDQPDVAAATRTREGKLLPHPRHELGPSNSRRVRGGWLNARVAVCVCGLGPPRMPAWWLVPLLRGVANRRCCDGRPQRVIRRERPLVAVPMRPGRRYQVRPTVKKLKRREFHDASLTRPRGADSVHPHHRHPGHCLSQPCRAVIGSHLYHHVQEFVPLFR